MKIIIRLAVAAALGSAAATGFGVSTGRASTFGNAPWCAVVNQGAGDIIWDCEYGSVAECTPNVLAGNRGFCERNPYYWRPDRLQASGPPPPVIRYRHHTPQ